MNNNLLKLVAVVILAFGVGLAASQAAQMTPRMRASSAESFVESSRSAALSSYCKSRAKLGETAQFSPQCPNPASPNPASPPTQKSADIDRSNWTAAQWLPFFEGELISAVALESRDLKNAEVLTALEAWKVSEQRYLKARSEFAVATVEPPSERLSIWFSRAAMNFLVGLALIAAGGIIFRKASGGATQGEEEKGGAKDFGDMLEKLDDDLKSVASSIEKGTSSTELMDEIDHVRREVIEPMIECREAIRERYGIAGLAEVIGPLSSAERLTNRAWSALVDEHVAEAKDSIARALEHVGETKVALINISA